MRKTVYAIVRIQTLLLLALSLCLHAYSQTMSRGNKLIVQRGIKIHAWVRNDHVGEGRVVPPREKQTIGRSGRYVRMQLSNTETLYLAEVQVFSGGTNIALNKTTSQSATSASSSRAVDGNTNGNYAGGSVSATALGRSQMEPWWQVDLGSVATIDSIVIWSRTDIDTNHIKGYYLFVSDNAFTATTLLASFNQAGVSRYTQAILGVPFPPAAHLDYASLVPQYYEVPGYNYTIHQASPNMKWSMAKAGKIPIPHSGLRGPSAFETSNGFLNSVQLSNLGNLQSICIGDEENYSTEAANNYKSWFDIIRSKYPDVLVHSNQAVAQWNATQIRSFMGFAKPDMITFDRYYFNSPPQPGNSIPTLYEHMQVYRKLALEGGDGTGNSPILFGGYLQGYKGKDGTLSEKYTPSESEFNLNIFTYLAMGAKWLSHFIFSSNVFYISGQLTPQYYQIARTIHQSDNLSPHLSRLHTSDVRFIPGKHMVSGVPTNNASVANISAWSTTADPYVTSIVAANLDPGTNDGLPGDVLIGYFKPVPGLNNTPGINMAPVPSISTPYFMVVNGLNKNNGCCSNPAADTLLGKADLATQRITLGINFGSNPVDTLYRVRRSDGVAEIVPLTHVSGAQYTVSDTLDGGLADLFYWIKAGQLVPSTPHAVIFSTPGNISAGNVTQLNGTSKFTVESWVKFNSIGNFNNVYIKTTATTNRIALQTYSDGSLYANVSNGTNAYGHSAAGTITAGQWYHIAVVYDGTLSGNGNRLKLYINGVQKTLSYSSTVPSTASGTNTAPLLFGSASFNGIIDEVRVWNTSLSAVTISNWKDKALGSCHPNISNLALYWHLDNYVNYTVAEASLGTSYTGVITNGVYTNSSQANGASGCSGGMLAVSAPVSEVVVESAGNIYPNPVSSDVVYIQKMPQVAGGVFISVFNMDGQLLKSAFLSTKSIAGPVAFNTGKLAPGTYILKVACQEGKIINTYKFIRM